MTARIKPRRTLLTFIILFFMSILSIFLICSLLTAGNDNKNSNVKSLGDLTSGWKMRIGDSPTDSNGTPLWTTGKGSEQGWENINYSENKASTHSAKTVWFKAKLSSFIPDSELLYLSKDFASEVYLDSHRLYKHGSFNKSKFKYGSKWNIVSLPSDSAGKTIYFRTYAPLPYSIGHSITGYIGSSKAIYEYKTNKVLSLFKDEIDFPVLAFLYMFIGIITMFIYFIRRGCPIEQFSMGFSSFTLGLWLIADRKIILSYFDCQVFWNNVAVILIQLVPIGFLSFIENIFGGRLKFILRKAWQYFIVYSVITFILDFTGIYHYYYSLKFFQLSLIIAMIIVIYTIISAAREGNKEAKILLFGVSVLCFTGISDIIQIFYLDSSKYLNHHVTQWGMFFFILSMVYILGLRFVKVYNKLIAYSAEIEEKNKTLSQMWEEVKQSRDKIAEWNKELERIVATRTASIKNLLNNAGQGFLLFGPDLTVNEEYSSECINIFGKRIENLKFPELIFPENDEQRAFLEKILLKIFNSQNYSKREIYLPLIPDEITLGQRHINIIYKIIDNENSETIMAILTDITEKRTLENQMEREKNMLKMVVKVVVNYSDFCLYVRDYENFFKKKVHSILRIKSDFEIIFFEIFRNIHTFKGTFSQFDMLNTVGFLHNLESQMAGMRLDIKSMNIEVLKGFLAGLSPFDSLIEDMDILKGILGEQFFQQKNVFTIEKSRVLEIEKKALGLLSPFECKMLLPDLKRLMYKPFNELLKIYPEYVMKKAENMEKLLNPLIIEGEDIPVDTELYYDFTKSLVHVFKNMIDHGIESADERYESGKEELGTIRCNIDLVDSNIVVEISDDGRGMDLERIKAKAVEKGLFDESRISKLSENELIALTFKDEFSTKDDITEISGRGVGLSAVRREVDKLGGRIEVESIFGKGTTFRFYLPYETASEAIETSIQDIMNPLIASACDYLSGHLNEKVLSNDSFNVIKDDTLPLSKYSTIINIKGIIGANFVMTYDEKLAVKIAREYMPDNQGEFEKYVLESISECSNIILGGSLKMFQGIENMIMVSSPIGIYSDKALIKYQSLDVWTSNIKFKSGSLSLSLLLSENLLDALQN